MVGGIFFDLEKVFDCIKHNILLAKMGFSGIMGKAYSLIKSYLEHRYQRVNLKNKASNWGIARNSVPQGSIMGPLLFLIDINDSPKIAE